MFQLFLTRQVAKVLQEGKSFHYFLQSIVYLTFRAKVWAAVQTDQSCHGHHLNREECFAQVENTQLQGKHKVLIREWISLNTNSYESEVYRDVNFFHHILSNRCMRNEREWKKNEWKRWLQEKETCFLSFSPLWLSNFAVKIERARKFLAEKQIYSLSFFNFPHQQNNFSLRFWKWLIPHLLLHLNPSSYLSHSLCAQSSVPEPNHPGQVNNQHEGH